MTNPVTHGRNEPCPCGSGKKYKRCCGVGAAPKLSVSNATHPAFSPEFRNEAMENLDPQMMMQFSQALQRLPKGQMQRLQSIMQKAMAGKDVSNEAADFEKTLPPNFQQLMQSMMMAGAQSPDGGGMIGDPSSMLPDMSALTAGNTSGAMGMAAETPTEMPTEMTEKKAREIIERAAAEGSISKEKADSLLKGASLAVEPPSLSESPLEQKEEGKLGKFWRNISGKKAQ